MDVYRSRISTDSKNVDVYNIFTNDNFNKYYGMVKDQMVKTLKNEKIVGPRSLCIPYPWWFYPESVGGPACDEDL